MSFKVKKDGTFIASSVTEGSDTVSLGKDGTVKVLEINEVDEQGIIKIAKNGTLFISEFIEE